MSDDKQCAHCKKWFPKQKEYFHLDTSKASGFASICKVCKKVLDQGRYRRNNSRSHGYCVTSDGQKLCSKCRKSLPATNEYFCENKRLKSGLNSWCRACQKDYWKDYYLTDAYKEKNRVRQSQPDYRAKHNKQMGKWNQTEQGKVVRRARNQRRRAKLLGAEGFHTVADVALQYKSQRGKCWHCGKPLNGKYHVDHLIPLDKRGTDWPNNIVCACPKCNLSKSNKMCYEWNGKLV